MKYYIAGNRGLVGTHYSSVTNAIGGNTSTVDYSDASATYKEFERLEKDIWTTNSRDCQCRNYWWSTRRFRFCL